MITLGSVLGDCVGGQWAVLDPHPGHTVLGSYSIPVL